MASGAAHLVDAVIPKVPVRQFYRWIPLRTGVVKAMTNHGHAERATSFHGFADPRRFPCLKGGPLLEKQAQCDNLTNSRRQSPQILLVTSGTSVAVIRMANESR